MTRGPVQETSGVPVFDGDCGGAALLISRLRVLHPHGNPNVEHDWGPPRQAWLSKRGQIWFVGAEGEKPMPFLEDGQRIWNLEVLPARRRLEAIPSIGDEPVHALCIVFPKPQQPRKRYLASCDMKTRDQWVTACNSWEASPRPSDQSRGLDVAAGDSKASELDEELPLQERMKSAFSTVRADGILEVRVNAVSGLLCKIEAPSTWTLLELKAEVTRITQIPWREQRLVSGSEELQDAMQLSALPAGKSGLDITLIRRSVEQAFWCERLVHDGQALFAAPDSIRADWEAVLLAARSHGNALRCAEPRLQADRQIVLAAVKNSGRALAWASEELRNDREVVLAAVRADPGALVHAPLSFCADREVAMEVVARDLTFFGCLEESLRADRDVVLAAVRRDGAALEHAAPALRADRELVLEAVHTNGLALEHAAPALRADREIIVCAIKQNPHTLALAHPSLQEDDHLVWLARRRLSGY